MSKSVPQSKEMEMTLTTSRDPFVPEIIAVYLDGVNVYKWNEKHSIGTRTHHQGPKPSMKDIRAAVAAAV